MLYKVTVKNLAKHLDLANHRPDASEEKIRKLCLDVLKYGFNAAFVNPCFISLAREVLKNQSKVGTVISFPLGGDVLSLKKEAAKQAVLTGADELDVSLTIGLIKEGKWHESLEEMQEIVEAVREQGKKTIVKFIPETGYLTSFEIKKTAELILKAEADFIKTCSGFGPRGATLEDVFLIKQAVGDSLKIKVAGGIKTREQALSFIRAGAARIGTSQAVAIIKEREA